MFISKGSTSNNGGLPFLLKYYIWKRCFVYMSTKFGNKNSLKSGWVHSASLSRFEPHYASAIWRKAPLTGLFLKLRPWSASSTFAGCDFYNPMQSPHTAWPRDKMWYRRDRPGAIFVHGKIYTVLKRRHLLELFKGSTLGFPFAVIRPPTASQMLGGDADQWPWYARV